MTTNDLLHNRTTHEEVAQRPTEKYNIGNISAAEVDKDLHIGTTLPFQKEQILKDIMIVIGNRQVSVRELDIAPQWLLDKATTEKLDAN